MPLYDADNRLNSDQCSINLHDKDNENIFNYRFANLRHSDLSHDEHGERLRTHPLEQCARNRNLRIWNGYGVNGGVVDSDSLLRDGETTHFRSRKQLPKRIFHASPDFSRGHSSPVVEHDIVTGGNNPRKDGGVPDKLAEQQWNRFDPAVRPVSVDNIVPTWTNGGVPSRDVARSDEFLTSLGYVNRDGVWQHQSART